MNAAWLIASCWMSTAAVTQGPTDTPRRMLVAQASPAAASLPSAPRDANAPPEASAAPADEPPASPTGPPPDTTPPPPPAVLPPPPSEDVYYDSPYDPGPYAASVVEPPPPPNSLELDVLSIVAGYVSLRYERALTKRWALAINPLVGYWFYDSHLFLAGASIQARWYLGKHGMRGWYMSPQVQGTYLRQTEERANGHLFSVRALIGYRWYVDEAVSLFLGVGAQWWWLDMGNNQQNLQAKYDGFDHLAIPMFASESGIGVAF